MQTIKTIRELRQCVQAAMRNGDSIGFVPTMGYLHEGHLELVKTAAKHHQMVVASIFVNPLQFGPNEDFAAYPRDFERDAALLESVGCDILFAPSVEEMYPRPTLTTVDVASLGETLCGQTRPTHFRGVTTVVTKLLNIVQPHSAYFGEKDGQQLIIIKRMVADLNMPVVIVGVPIVRESSGLAKSSRNVYLTETEREHAAILQRTLLHVKAQIDAGERDAKTLIVTMKEAFAVDNLVRLDYVEIVDMDTLQPVATLQGDIMIAVAAYVGKARLIDNIQLHLS